MKDFLRKYNRFDRLAIKIVLAGVVGVLVAGVVFYFGHLRGVFEGGASRDSTSTGSVDNCLKVPELADGAVRMVTKVIDGDTVLIEGGYSVRLLGIDADERGYPCYSAAKERLEEMVLGKEVRLEKEKEDKDKWCRYLRYVFVGDVNVGLELVKEGLVVARASAEDSKYQKEIALAERLAIDNEIGCKWGGQARLPDRQGAVESDRGGFGQEANYQWSRLTPELTGLKVVEACSAAKYYGQEVIVEGWVADGYRSKTNTVFLNFERAYPNQCFTAVIFSSDQYRFIQNPEEYYANQMVRIKGEVKEYKGKPEIILKKAEQIERGKAL